MNSIYTEEILNRIHNTDRKIVDSTICGFSSKLCLLDFIGCTDTFITDTGIIWSRTTIKSSRKDPVLYRKYTNITFPDKFYRTPWVMLTDDEKRKIWLPVIQLLGWAFHPETDRTKRYYRVSGNVNILHSSLIESCTSRPDDVVHLEKKIKRMRC